MFAVKENKFFPNHIEASTQTIPKLVPGMYEFDMIETMFSSIPYFRPMPFRQGLVSLTGAPFNAIRSRLSKFFSPETIQIYKDIETRHFVGCLLYGPPGTGKTCFIDTLCSNFVGSHNALILRVTDAYDLANISNIVKLMREEDETIMIVIVAEEIDKIMIEGGRGNVERSIIDFCDGTSTPNNTLLICSTNHIADIPKSMKERPSRFSIVEEIDRIPEAIARQVVEKFVPEKYRTKISIPELSYKVTQDKVRIDQIKYIVLNILCAGMTVDKAVKKATKEALVGVELEEDTEEY